MFSSVDRIPACDGRTDIHTFCNSTVRAMHTRRALKKLVYSFYHKKNKKYVLSNSESVQCNFFIFDHVTLIQFKICCCVQNFIEIIADCLSANISNIIRQ